jgi:hypothetical protein
VLSRSGLNWGAAWDGDQKVISVERFMEKIRRQTYDTPIDDRLPRIES